MLSCEWWVTFWRMIETDAGLWAGLSLVLTTLCKPYLATARKYIETPNWMTHILSTPKTHRSDVSSMAKAYVWCCQPDHRHGCRVTSWNQLGRITRQQHKHPVQQLPDSKYPGSSIRWSASSMIKVTCLSTSLSPSHSRLGHNRAGGCKSKTSESQDQL